MKSETDVWNQMWRAECRRANEAQQKAHEAELRFIAADWQRFTLKAHLQLAANCLRERFPNFSQRLHDLILELDVKYEKTTRAHSTAAPGGSQNEAGGGAVPETAAQLEGTEALPVSDGSSCLPPAVKYAGNWDDCALMRKQAD